MKKILLAVVVLAAAATLGAIQLPPPRDWIDSATGHRVVRLTDDVLAALNRKGKPAAP